MKKTILIFGAGLGQLTLIKAAKDLGITSVVIDPNPDAPGKAMADYFFCVAGNDYERTKQIALEKQVNGIVTGQMEQPLKIMARLAEELGYIFNSRSIIEKCRNKYLMKSAFLKNNVPCAKGVLLGPGQNVTIDSLNNFDFPVIIKPSDAYSSRGVFKADSFEQLTSFVNTSRSFSSDHSIIVEEFIQGPEYSIEAVTFEGNTTIVQYTKKLITPFPKTVEIGHVQPADMTNDQKEHIEVIVKKAIQALGIDNTASHTELKLTSSGPKIIEIGARLGGDFIPSYLTLSSTGVNMDKAAIQVALGEKPDLVQKFQKCSFIKYLELEPGKKVKKILDYSDILTRPKVVFANIFIKEGQTVPEITDSAQRPACILIQENSIEQSYITVELMENLLKSRIILTS